MFQIMKRIQYITTTIFSVILLLLLSACGPEASLHQALRDGSEEQAIAALNSVDNMHMRYVRYADGFTPLHLAVYNGHKQLVYELVGRGADINSRTFKGRTPLALATVNGDDELAKYFIDKGAKLKTNYIYTNVFFDAVYANNNNMVDYYLNNGFDINMLDGYGRTALHVAGGKNHTQMIKHLLDSGAFPKQVDNSAKNSFATGIVYKFIAEMAYEQKENSKAKDAYLIAANSFERSAETYAKLIENVGYILEYHEDRLHLTMDYIDLTVNVQSPMMEVINPSDISYKEYGLIGLEFPLPPYLYDKRNKLFEELTQLKDDALEYSKLCGQRSQVL